MSIFLLLLRFWREASMAALALLLVASCHARDSALKREGETSERVRVADSTIHANAARMARVDTQLIHDTVRVRVAVEQLVTLRDTLLKNVHDTTVVLRFVTRADSAARACTELSNDCQAFRAFATQKIAALESTVNAAPVARPQRHLGSDVLKVSAGALAGWFAHRR